MPGPLDLTGPSRPPRAGGPAQHLIVLLHGLGADGNDLLGLSPHWAGLLPHAAFVAPDAPYPCDMAPVGRQWFSFRDQTPERTLASVEAVAQLLNGFLDDTLAAQGLADDRLALVGFSQGAMMALHVAARRAKPCAAVVGYSGMLLAPARLAADVRSRPPVLLVHGDADSVIPASAMPAAKTGLEAAGFAVEAQLRRGLAHGIDGEGLALGGRFLARQLPR